MSASVYLRIRAYSTALRETRPCSIDSQSSRNGNKPLNRMSAVEGRVFWTRAPIRGLLLMMRASQGATRLISS